MSNSLDRASIRRTVSVRTARRIESMQPKWHRIQKHLIIGATALTVLPSILAQSTGGISGVVVGDDGRLLAAVVTAHRMGMPAAGGRADAAADGSFAVSGIPPATSGLCA